MYNSSNLKPTRYAHSDGHTDLCYDDSGRYLITCGTDGDIRIWDGFEDDDPLSYHMGETVYAISFKNGFIYVSSDTNSVQAYTFPSVESDGIVVQFSSPVYHISCSKDGKFIAAGGGDFTIKVVEITNKNQNVLRGHDAPLLSVCFDPETKYLASSSCDGTVCIWSLLDQQSVKKWNLFPKSNDFCTSKTLCRLEWHPDGGKFLGIPIDKEIKLYQKNTWECMLSLTDESITETISIARFSPCGSYLAAACVNGQILIWDVKEKKCVERQRHEKELKICSLVWNPSGKKELSYCDIQGQLGILEDVCNSKIDSNQGKSFSASSSNNEELDLVKLKNKSDHSEKFENCSSLTLMNNKNYESEDDDDADFDIGAIKSKLEPTIFGLEDDGGAESDATSVKSEPKYKPVEIPTTPLQTPFQPASTPVHLQHRFMLWNTVGIVRCYNTEEENSIDVEFHDSSVHHAIHLVNSHSHTMAALSVEALLMACLKDDDNPSKLVCMHFGTWDSTKEWSMDMLDNEQIEAIALGTGWVAAATDKRFVRLYTISGVQCEVFCLPGPVVCMAGQDKQLVISYHQGAGIPGEQNLALMIVNVKLKTRSTSKIHPLPLSPKSFLSWLGYTDESTICIVDTSGIVKLLNNSFGSSWIPVANTKAQTKGKSDHYFVVGLSEMQQQIRCIPCKGSRYPPILPRPTVTVLPLELPFCEMSTDKGRFEEELGKTQMLYKLLESLVKDGFEVDTELQAADRKRTDVLLKMFALATRSDREYRAMEVAELMPSHRAVQGAIKYATQRHHMALAERLGEVAHLKLVDESVNMSDQEEEPIEEMHPKINLQNYEPSVTRADSPIQPKPLSHSRHSLTRDVEHDFIHQGNSPIKDGFEEHDSDNAVKSLLPNSDGQKNPFKIQSQAKHAMNKETKQSQSSIDDILQESTKRLSSSQKATTSSPQTEHKKKTPRQSKLFAPNEKAENKAELSSNSNEKKFGFPLFLEENKERIVAENPELEEHEVMKEAAKQFRQLPREEKEKFKKNVKKIEGKESADVTLSGKRKRMKDDSLPVEKKDEEVKKKLVKENSKKLSTSTTSKLTMFAFTRKDSQ